MGQGWYTHQPKTGLRAAARVHAGWGFSQAFYWHEEWRTLDFTSLEDFLVGFWEDSSWMTGTPTTCWPCCGPGSTATWAGQDTEVRRRHHRGAGLNPGTDHPVAGRKDRYFPPEDAVWASEHIPNSEVRVIPGICGHFAGGGSNPADIAFIDKAVKELLS